MSKSVTTAAFAAALALFAIMFSPDAALAQDAKASAGDTAWILTATALVLFMTLPGLALFYGGLVRARNLLSVLMQCFAVACLMSVMWLVIVYSLAFGDGGVMPGSAGSTRRFCSASARIALRNNSRICVLRVPDDLYVITPALIVGAYVEQLSSAPCCGSARSGSCWCMRRSVTGSGAAAGWPSAVCLPEAGRSRDGGVSALVIAKMLGGRQGSPGNHPAAPPRPDRRSDAVGRLVRINAGSAPGAAGMAMVVTHISRHCIDHLDGHRMGEARQT